MKNYQLIIKQIEEAYDEYVYKSKKIMDELTEDELMEFNRWYSLSKSFNRPVDKMNHTVSEVAEKLTMLLNMKIITNKE